jgi:hypothetical protein
MNKRILVSEEEKKSILKMHESFKRTLVKEDDEMGGQKCSFTIDDLISKNKQFEDKSLQNASFKVRDTIPDNLQTSVKKGQTLSHTQTYSMAEGEIVLEPVVGLGQASISCDGTSVTLNVGTD